MFRLTRRDACKALLIGGASTAAPWVPAQQGFPTKPMRIVVPTSAGGGSDLIGRSLAERLQADSGEQVVVENRTGGSSTIGTRFVAQAPADGHTALIVGYTFASTPAIMADAGYDPVKDFVGVSMLARLANMLVVPASSPYQSVAELVAAAKARPGELTFATAGAGSVARFVAERFAHRLGLRLVHVPYKGNAEALADLLAGRISMMFDQTVSLPHVKSGRLRALALTASARSPLLPDLPTFAEAGIKDFEDYAWVGLVVPAGVPRETLVRMHASVTKALQSPDLRSRLTAQGLEVVGSARPEEFTGYIREETTRLAKLARDVGIKVE